MGSYGYLFHPRDAVRDSRAQLKYCRSTRSAYSYRYRRDKAHTVNTHTCFRLELGLFTRQCLTPKESRDVSNFGFLIYADGTDGLFGNVANELSLLAA